MKLIRVGKPGFEKPGIYLGDNKYIDTSSFCKNYDEEFFNDKNREIVLSKTWIMKIYSLLFSLLVTRRLIKLLIEYKTVKNFRSCNYDGILNFTRIIDTIQNDGYVTKTIQRRSYKKGHPIHLVMISIQKTRVSWKDSWNKKIWVQFLYSNLNFTEYWEY